MEEYGLLLSTLAIILVAISIGVAIIAFIRQGENAIREDNRDMRNHMFEIYQRVSRIEGAADRPKDVGKPSEE